MALKVEKIVSAYCPICGWRKFYNPADLNVDIPCTCPVCDDGRNKTWQMKDKKKRNPNDRSQWGLPA